MVRSPTEMASLCELPVKIGPEGVMATASPSSSPVPPMTVAHSPAPSDAWYLAMNTSFSMPMLSSTWSSSNVSFAVLVWTVQTCVPSLTT